MKIPHTLRQWIIHHLPEVVVIMFLMWMSVLVTVIIHSEKVRRSDLLTHGNQDSMKVKMDKYLKNDKEYFENIDSLKKTLNKIK